MMNSPWDGTSRRPLRIGLALVAGLSLVLGAGDAHRLAFIGDLSRDAPPAVLALARSKIALGLILGAGLAAIVRFVQKPAAVRPGLALFAVLTAMAEGVTALAHGPRREYFGVGAVLFGWIAGLLYARALRPDGAPSEADEALAETGAIAGMAATYANAATSKLVHAGLGWADATSLRGLVLSHHRIDDTSLFGAYAKLVVDHPAPSRALMLSALALQATAFLYVVGPRFRMVWGTSLLLFHLNVGFLAHIGYVQSHALLLLFSYPWPRIVAWVRRRPAPAGPLEPPPIDPARHRRVALRLLMILLVAGALAWLLSSRRG